MPVCMQMGRSVTDVQELGRLANNLTQSYSDLAAESCRIARVCPTPQVLIHSLLRHVRQHKNKIQKKYTAETYIKRRTVKQTGREHSKNKHRHTNRKAVKSYHK